MIVDVFSNTPLQGNCSPGLHGRPGALPEEMLKLARELNFSETTFVLPAARRRAVADADLHALGGGAVRRAPDARDGVRARDAAPARRDPARDRTRHRFRSASSARARIVFGRMEQPLPAITPFERADELQAALGVESQLPVEVYDNGLRHVYVALGSDDEVAALRPDQQRLAALGAYGINCFAGDGLTWKTRMFAPSVGVPEDPATGSAAGPLAVHLARHGRIAFGDEIEISQGADRPPVDALRARRRHGDAVERIEVGGSAVIVARGEFRISAGTLIEASTGSAGCSARPLIVARAVAERNLLPRSSGTPHRQQKKGVHGETWFP